MTRKKRPSDQRPSALVREREAPLGRSGAKYTGFRLNRARAVAARPVLDDELLTSRSESHCSLRPIPHITEKDKSFQQGRKRT